MPTRKPAHRLDVSNIGPRIVVVVGSGGPCSGKSQMGRILAGRIEKECGWKVLCPQEAATILRATGIVPGPELPGRMFQEMILDLSDRLLRHALRAAMHMRDQGAKVLVLCDRGLMDGQAYVEPDAFRDMYHGLGYRLADMRDLSCHGVVFLRSAANGAESFYGTATNDTRVESLEEARALDERTLHAWVGHPHLRVVDNHTDFEGKLERVFLEICAMLGYPVPLEREEKYLINLPDLTQLPLPYSLKRIEQVYLVSEDPAAGERVRREEDEEHVSIYTHTIKRATGEKGVRKEVERIITRGEYSEMLRRADPQSRRIRKRRIRFPYGDRQWDIDFFERPVRGLTLLEIEHSEPEPVKVLPPFIEVVQDVTDDPRYSNREIARGSLGK